MSWTCDVNLGPLSFTVTKDDADHAAAGGAVAGEAWLVESLRVGWRVGDLPPAKPEPITASLAVACHPPALLRELDEGQPADVTFTLAGDTGATPAVYAAGRIGGPLVVSTVERNGVMWGVTRIELVDYTVDLATLTVTVPAIPAQTFYERAGTLDDQLTADTGVGFLDYSATLGGPYAGDQRFGLTGWLGGFAGEEPYHAAIEAGAYSAADLVDNLLVSHQGIPRPHATRLRAIKGQPDNAEAEGCLPVVVPVVDPAPGAPGQLLGYVLTAIQKVSEPALLPAKLGATPDGYGLVVNDLAGASRYLTAAEIEPAGGWVRDRVSTRVTVTHGGAGAPASVTVFDPNAGDSRIVSRDVSTDLVDNAPAGGAEAEWVAGRIALGRLPTRPYDRLGWRLGSFTWHPLASSPTTAGNVLRAAIPDHSDISAFSTRDAMSQPWWITGVTDELAFSDRSDYAGTLEAADFLLDPARLPADYALTFSLVRRIAEPMFSVPYSPILSATTMTGALATIDAGDLDPALTFSDLSLARTP